MLSKNWTGLNNSKKKERNYTRNLDNARKELAALGKLGKRKTPEQAKMDRLKRNLFDKERERNAVKERLNNTKALDELKQQDAELKHQIIEDWAVINDKNT